MSIATTVTPAIPAGIWKLDAVHSSARYSVTYIAGRFRSGFASFDATLDATGGEPRLEGTIDVSSLTIDLEPFRNHLLGEEFFDAERHPELRFVSTAFRRDGDRVEVEGDLTLRGVTKPVTATGAITGPTGVPFGDAKALGLRLEAVLDRTSFGLDWNADFPAGGPALAREVRLEIDLQLQLQE